MKIDKYFKEYGLIHYENFMEAVKLLFPEIALKGEMELFDFSSTLLQSPNKISQ